MRSARRFSWGTGELVSFKNTDGVAFAGLAAEAGQLRSEKEVPDDRLHLRALSQGLHQWRRRDRALRSTPAYYVSNGYLIFMPDIVYTTGYPGPSALKCVLPAVQAVVDKGFVDEKNIGIQGHSWGGYQIAYMVTQTNRFKAAEAGAAVANMTSAYSGIRWGYWPAAPVPIRAYRNRASADRFGNTRCAIWKTRRYSISIKCRRRCC